MGKGSDGPFCGSTVDSLGNDDGKNQLALNREGMVTPESTNDPRQEDCLWLRASLRLINGVAKES